MKQHNSQTMVIDGFKLYNTCRCGGVLQHKYHQVSNTTNRYIIFPVKGQVRIQKNNLTMGIFPLNKLEEKLREYEII